MFDEWSEMRWVKEMVGNGKSTQAVNISTGQTVSDCKGKWGKSQMEWRKMGKFGEFWEPIVSRVGQCSK